MGQGYLGAGRMKLTLGTIATLLVVSTAAMADTIPRYDPPGYCRTVSEVSGGSQMIYNGCLGMEQDAYDSLKASWDSLPSKTRSYCDEVGRVSGGSYSILKGCIDMETDAASSTPGFKFCGKPRNLSQRQLCDLTQPKDLHAALEVR